MINKLPRRYDLWESQRHQEQRAQTNYIFWDTSICK